MSREAPTERMLISNEELRILVAEDNHTIINYLRSILRRHLAPVKIEIVENGHEALRKLTEQDYDIALIDYALPTIKGEEIAKTIRANKIETPILLLALSEVKIPVEVIIGMGVDGIVYKPIEQKELLEEIKQALDISLMDRGSISKFHRIPGEFLKE